MKEYWKCIKNYEGYYQISNLGRVKSLKRIIKHKTLGHKTINEKILKNVKDNNGYLIVSLHKYGKRKKVYVHKLVAEAFLKKSHKDQVVDHIDNNPSNPNISNLQYVSQGINCLKDKKRKLNNYGVTKIKRRGGVEYCARIQVQNKRVHLCSFSNKERAFKLYNYCFDLLQNNPDISLEEFNRLKDIKKKEI